MRPFALLLLLSACGGEPEVTFATTIQWAAQIECSAGHDTLGQNMRAILEIGGHDPCVLTVDPTTLEASGQCETITIGIERPLALRYSVADPITADLVTLAVLIGDVDLRKDTLGDNRQVEVTLTGDGISSVQVDTDAEVDALAEQDDCTGLVDETEARLCAAEAWAKRNRQVELVSVDFDIDDDSESNLVEVCANTLFD